DYYCQVWGSSTKYMSF
nr:immunoglobulin light chain junction region [Macaca mulatta]